MVNCMKIFPRMCCIKLSDVESACQHLMYQALPIVNDVGKNVTIKWCIGAQSSLTSQCVNWEYFKVINFKLVMHDQALKFKLIWYFEEDMCCMARVSLKKIVHRVVVFK